MLEQEEHSIRLDWDRGNNELAALLEDMQLFLEAVPEKELALAQDEIIKRTVHAGVSRQQGGGFSLELAVQLRSVSPRTGA